MGLSNGKKKILIVDDAESNRNAFAGYVSGEMEVFTAEDGLQGLKELMKNRPHMIFTDLEMPNMDGLNL